MDIRAMVDQTLIAPMREQAAAARAERMAKLEDVLREIVNEYEATYDADCEGGTWTGAASIPVDVMERAQALLLRA
jgi:hypothetical protein